MKCLGRAASTVSTLAFRSRHAPGRDHSSDTVARPKKTLPDAVDLPRSVAPVHLTPTRNDQESWDFFVSHTQRNHAAAALATDLYYSLQKRGFSVWLDIKMDDRSEAAMEYGVRNSRCVIAIITKGPTSPNDDYFARTFCLSELRWAIDANVQIQPVIAVQDKDRIHEFLAGAPADLRQLGSIDFIDLNRGDHEYWAVGVKKIVRAARAAPRNDPTMIVSPASITSSDFG